MNKTQHTPKHRREEAVSLTISRLIVCGGGQKQKKEHKMLTENTVKMIEELCEKRFNITRNSFNAYYVNEWINRYKKHGLDFTMFMDGDTLKVWKSIINNQLNKRG